jgi:hypothetical protein
MADSFPALEEIGIKWKTLNRPVNWVFAGPALGGSLAPRRDDIEQAGVHFKYVPAGPRTLEFEIRAVAVEWTS